MKLCSLTSGSSGNSIFVGTNQTNILVDCGASAKYIFDTLDEIKINSIDAILVTHEHIDHICGLGVIMRKYQIPVYITEDTLSTLIENNKLGKVDFNLFNIIRPDREFFIGDIRALPFSISHDAVNPVAYRLECDDKEIAVATDMGIYDEYTIGNLKDIDAILIEANYDINMLECGDYSWSLKQRILGDKGHLSNYDSSVLLSKIITERTKNILLGHLSSENNYHELAKLTVDKNLRNFRDDINIDSINIDVVRKKIRGNIIEI